MSGLISIAEGKGLFALVAAAVRCSIWPLSSSTRFRIVSSTSLWFRDALLELVSQEPQSKHVQGTFIHTGYINGHPCY